MGARKSERANERARASKRARKLVLALELVFRARPHKKTTAQRHGGGSTEICLRAPRVEDSEGDAVKVLHVLFEHLAVAQRHLFSRVEERAAAERGQDDVPHTLLHERVQLGLRTYRANIQSRVCVIFRAHFQTSASPQRPIWLRIYGFENNNTTLLWHTGVCAAANDQQLCADLDARFDGVVAETVRPAVEATVAGLALALPQVDRLAAQTRKDIRKDIRKHASTQACNHARKRTRAHICAPRACTGW